MKVSDRRASIAFFFLDIKKRILFCDFQGGQNGEKSWCEDRIQTAAGRSWDSPWRWLSSIPAIWWICRREQPALPAVICWHMRIYQSSSRRPMRCSLRKSADTMFRESRRGWDASPVPINADYWEICGNRGVLRHKGKRQPEDVQKFHTGVRRTESGEVSLII